MCAWVSASLVYARLKSVHQWRWLIFWVAERVSLCGHACVCLCVCPSICISVSDRCVGSGLQSCWRRAPARLCLVGRSGHRHSRSAGTAPGHGCPSCGGGCTPGPLSARACRYETRSVWRNTGPLSNLQTSDKYPLPDLRRENICPSAKRVSSLTCDNDGMLVNGIYLSQHEAGGCGQWEASWHDAPTWRCAYASQ